MAFSKMTAAAVAIAAGALALLAPAVHARESPLDGGVELTGFFESLQEEIGSPGEPSAVPAVSDDGNTFQTRKLILDGGIVMTVSSYYSKDRRDSESYYVCTTSEKSKFLAATFVGDDWFGSCGEFMLQIDEVNSHSSAAKQVKGWYLTVLKEIATDSLYEDHVRLVAHPDPYRAAKWYLDFVDPYTSGSSEYYLRVSYAPLQPQLKGAYLTIPPDSKRDKSTDYLAVGSSRDNALSITLE